MGRALGHLLSDYDAKAFFDERKECLPYKPKTKQAKRIEGILLHLLPYLWTHRRRMTYREFRQRGWPIGSGAIESAHKHVLQRRMKLPGLAWSPQNAQRMATLLALQASVGPRAFYQHLEQHLAHAA